MTILMWLLTACGLFTLVGYMYTGNRRDLVTGMLWTMYPLTQFLPALKLYGLIILAVIILLLLFTPRSRFSPDKR